MMRLFKIVFWVMIVLVAIGLLPMATKLLLVIAKNRYIWFGFIAFFIVYILWLKGRISFLQTLDHELSHMIVSLLCGNTMVEMYVHDRMGGHVKYYGRGNVLISLAPYVIRIPILLVTILSCFISPNKSIFRIFYILFGVVLCYSIISILEEAKPYQTDLRQHGLLFSYSAIIALNIICFCMIASVILPRFELLDVFKSLVKIF